MVNISEIKRRAAIGDVWAALGGGKLRGNRGQAFWRDGDGYNIALYPQTGTWHDFVSGDGGDVFTLVRTVQQCSFHEAGEWLARHAGVSVDNCQHRVETTADWRSDLESATWWARGAELYAEWALEELPSWSLQRRGPTVLLQTIKLGDAALVGEYREWRKHHPQLTAAMIRAGRLHDARVQRRLALWLRRYLDEQQTA